MQLRASRAAYALTLLTAGCALSSLAARDLLEFPDVVSFGDSSLQEAVLGSAHYLEEGHSGKHSFSTMKAPHGVCISPVVLVTALRTPKLQQVWHIGIPAGL